jgi:hypothetical protein
MHYREKIVLLDYGGYQLFAELHWTGDMLLQDAFASLE